MLKKFTLVAAAALVALPAFADDQTIDISSGSASFASLGTVLAGGSDTLTFTGLASGVYNFVLYGGALNVSNLVVTLGGQSVGTLAFPPVTFFASVGTDSSPFSLVLSGTPGPMANYSGTLTVSPVPEPETYAMLLAGLGIVGMLARRRKSTQA